MNERAKCPKCGVHPCINMEAEKVGKPIAIIFQRWHNTYTCIDCQSKWTADIWRFVWYGWELF